MSLQKERFQKHFYETIVYFMKLFYYKCAILRSHSIAQF